MRYCFFVAVLLLSCNATAQSLPDISAGVPETSVLPQSAIPAPTTDFIVSGWTLPTEWHFSVGPLKQPENTILRLTRRVPGGAVGIQCSRTAGTMELSFVVDGYKPEEGKAVYSLKVGRNTGPVELSASKPSDKEPDIVLSVNNPVAITDILYSMSMSQAGDLITLETPDRRSFNTTLPAEIQISSITAAVCDEWHKTANAH